MAAAPKTFPVTADDVQTLGLPGSPRYASTWDDLARALGVSRKSLQNWRGRDDLAGKLPSPRADGRHDISAWLRAMIDNRLARADEDVAPDAAPEIQPDFPSGTVTDWKRRREQLQCTQLERSIAKEDGKLLVAAELEIAVGQLLAGLQTALSRLPSAAARFLVGIRDVHVVEERLQGEVDALLSQLNLGLYLEEILPAIAAEFPIDPTLPEHLRNILARCVDPQLFVASTELFAREALARIGRRALAGLASGDTKCDLSDPETPSIHAASEEISRTENASPTSAKKPRKSPRKNTSKKVKKKC